MAKKTVNSFVVELRKNTTKGGAWLCVIKVLNESGDAKEWTTTAWSNASAGKRWIKEEVQRLTPRKSVKLLASLPDEKEKPTYFYGNMSFKVDA
jgi:hypothetical protein